MVGILLSWTLGVAIAAQAAPKPPEYDPAAEVTITGTVEATHESKVASDHPGLHLVLKTDSGTVEVHLCPIRFLKELEFSIGIGDTLTVVGSRPEGAPHLVARSIKKGNATLIVRDAKGEPNWTR
jgi:hypothetical protein